MHLPYDLDLVQIYTTTPKKNKHIQTDFYLTLLVYNEICHYEIQGQSSRSRAQHSRSSP